MKIVDIRPTLASWPKRIYEWHELPEVFRPALEDWKKAGMEPGNVTYIPKVMQGKNDAEYATAWWQDQVMVQVYKEDALSVNVFTAGQVPSMMYEHQTLQCKVLLPLKDSGELEFGFAQVKEDQVRPVINLLLGQPADRPFPIDHPDHSMDWMIKQTLMYHPAIYCYRFDDKINDSVWFRSSLWVLPFIARRRPRPEYFFANMDRGLVVIDRNFYRRRIFYFTWEDIASIKMEPHQWKRGPGVNVVSKSGLTAQVPLLEENIKPVAEYLEKLKKLNKGIEIVNDTAGLMDKK